MDTPLHSVSVAGVVINDRDEVLVIKRRDNGQWEPPGGVLELNETFEEGVRREVLEETGVAVTVDRLTGVYKNMTRGIVALVFRCTPIAGTAVPTSEAVGVQWAPLSTTIAAMKPAYAARISDALTPGATIRTHDGSNLLSTM